MGLTQATYPCSKDDSVATATKTSQLVHCSMHARQRCGLRSSSRVGSVWRDVDCVSAPRQAEVPVWGRG